MKEKEEVTQNEYEKIRKECGEDKELWELSGYFFAVERGLHLMAAFFSKYGYEEITSSK